jgi:tetratricopeptide (TPR) repeat protein
LYREVARDIAAEIEIELTDRAESLLAGAAPVEPQAYDAYVKGRYHLTRRGEESIRAAISHFEEAIEGDPAFAAAHAALAEALWTWAGRANDPTGERAKQAALRAVELDDQLAEAHLALALVRRNEWDWRGSEEEFRRAIELNPNLAAAHQWYSQLLRETERYDEAMQEIRRAEELDPLSLRAKTMVGWVMFNQRRYDEALAQWDMVLEMDPDFTLAIYNQGLAFAMKGMGEAVMSAVQRAESMPGWGNVDSEGLLALGHAILGHRDQAEIILQDVEQQSVVDASGWIAMFHMQLGEEDQALDWLEKAYEQGDPDLPNLTSEPWFDALREHPRFKALRAEMGLS